MLRGKKYSLILKMLVLPFSAAVLLLCFVFCSFSCCNNSFGSLFSSSSLHVESHVFCKIDHFCHLSLILKHVITLNTGLELSFTEEQYFQKKPTASCPSELKLLLQHCRDTPGWNVCGSQSQKFVLHQITDRSTDAETVAD